VGTVTLLRRARRGPRRGPRGVNVGYGAINNSAAAAYRKQTGNPSGVAGNSTLKHLLRRLEEFLRYLGAPYQVPVGTSDNDAILLYLWKVSRWYETATNANYSGNPDRGILDAIDNANHKSCMVLLDSILQGISAYKQKQYPPGDRPTYVAGTSETDYFVGYVDSIGNV
jgi:hypothetical protein